MEIKRQTRRKKKLNLFSLFWVEQKVTWVKHNLMKLFVPSRERRHLQIKETKLDRQLSFNSKRVIIKKNIQGNTDKSGVFSVS